MLPMTSRPAQAGFCVGPILNKPATFEVPRPAGWTPQHEARWDQVCTRVLRIEGGHVDDPVDRGGETKYGISLRFLKAAGGLDANGDGFGDLDLNFDTVLDGQDIRALTPEIARSIYLKHFFIGPELWSLLRPYDAAMFDQAVNGGTTAAIKILQRALNRQGKPYLKVDGVLGPKTRAALAERLRYGYPVLQAVREEAAERYRAIVRADPSQKRFLKGWERRAAELGRV